MEKSAALKRLKKRCLCMVLSLLLAFGFAANEAFGFEFPLDADEPILNETEIALSEKVMNLELAVRTMKTKKKNVKVVVHRVLNWRHSSMKQRQRATRYIISSADL